LVTDGVTILRGPEHEGHPNLGEPFRVTLLTSAAPRRPRLTANRKYLNPGDRNAMLQAIRLTLEGARQAGCVAVVLSALGCGAFSNPPEVVAKLMDQALHAFTGVFREAVISIMDDHNSGGVHNPRGNFTPFMDHFHSAAVEPDVVAAADTGATSVHHGLTGRLQTTGDVAGSDDACQLDGGPATATAGSALTIVDMYGHCRHPRRLGG
jgi:hypothetical protein